MTRHSSPSLLAYGRRNYLPVALLVSAAIHAAVIAVQWHSAPPPAPPRSETLELTLVNTRTATEPVAPAVLAQASLDGGGESEAGLASSPLPRTSEQPTPEQVLEALQQERETLEAVQNRLLTQLASTTSVRAAPEDDSPAPEAGNRGEDAVDQESVILSSRIAALQERVEQYNRRPRTEFIGPSAKGVDYAAYLEAWRQKIELIGTRHYPPEARGKIYGDLQMTVFIRRDGSVERVEIDRPSAEPVLNLAASRIVQLAAPFAPLPDAIASRTDLLAITRTWHFVNDQLETRAP